MKRYGTQFAGKQYERELWKIAKED